jgi:hypothetical protein
MSKRHWGLEVIQYAEKYCICAEDGTEIAFNIYPEGNEPGLIAGDGALTGVVDPTSDHVAVSIELSFPNKKGMRIQPEDTNLDLVDLYLKCFNKEIKPDEALSKLMEAYKS